MIKNYFLTGLIVLLPVTITILLVLFVFNLLTEPFTGIVKDVLDGSPFLENTPLYFKHISIQIFIFIFLFLFTIILGMFGRWLFLDHLIRASEKLVKRIPFISSLYNMSKDVINTLFATTNNSFKQVVLVPYPNQQTLCMGLITREDLKGLGSKSDLDFIAVFVPCTPNPTSGFLMMFKKEDILFLEMRVEDAFKYIISCGVTNVSMDLKKL